MPIRGKRRRLLIVVTALGVLGCAGILLLALVGETPEVRLLDGPEKQVGLDVLREFRPKLSFGLTGLEPTPWIARFEIRAPQGSRMILTNGAIRVEMRDANGDRVAAGSFPANPMADVILGDLPRTVIRPRLPVAPPTTSVTFSVGYKQPSLRQRGRMAFTRWGIKHRAPRLADLVVGWLPDKERWETHHATVRLPPFPDGSETDGLALPANRPAPGLEPDVDALSFDWLSAPVSDEDF